MARAGTERSEPWRIHFFQRDRRDDASECAPVIEFLDGLSKPRRTAADPRDYRRVKRYGAEFQMRRTVLK